MNYTAEQIINAIKKYPENKPNDLTDGPLYHSIDKNDEINVHYWYDAHQHSFGHTKCRWFIDIPGAPEELKPVPYPQNRPVMSGEYVAHIKPLWVPLYYKKESSGWYRRQPSGCLRHIVAESVDFFINYRLEDEEEKGLVWKLPDGHKGITKVTRKNVNGFDAYVFDYKVSTMKPALLPGYAIEMSMAILNLEGYDITKRQPEIAPCPNPECGGECTLMYQQRDSPGWDEDPCYYVRCVSWRCHYEGPSADTKEKAIRLHGLIAGKDK